MLFPGEQSALSGLVREGLESQGAIVVTPPRPEMPVVQCLELVCQTHERVDAIIVPITSSDDVEVCAQSAHFLVELVRGALATQHLPRHVVGLIESDPRHENTELSLSLATTLVRYATAHSVSQNVRINAVHRPLAEDHSLLDRRVCDVTLALLSGHLDALRGQVLRVQEVGDGR